MSVDDYITSGILEAYLLGELSNRERGEVEAMADKHPVIKAEMLAIEKTLEAMAMKTAIVPKASLKGRILNNLSQEGIATPLEDQPLVISKTGSRGIMPYLAAASISIALITSIAAINFWNKWKDAESQLSDLITQNQRLAEDFNTTTHRLDQAAHDLSILSGAEYQKIVMNPVQPSEALASVFWNAQSQEVYLSITSLPQPPSDKQYQLWALVDGQPIDAGVFDLPEAVTSLLKMKPMVAADAFAITLEPKGGSISPTLEDLQVIGNV